MKLEKNGDFIYYYICDKRENLKMNEKRDKQTEKECAYEREREGEILLFYPTVYLSLFPRNYEKYSKILTP